jgi:hypothetical protein
MRTIGGDGVGRFSVEFDVANYGDVLKVLEGTLPRDQVRRQTISGVVDPGAAMLVLPPAVVKELGCRPVTRSKSSMPTDGAPSAGKRKGLTSSSWDATALSPPSLSPNARPP